MDSQTKSNISVFTIDVEDGINISMRDNFKFEMAPTERVVNNVKTILDLCNENNVKATFFILGEVAEYFPDLIKMIDSDGHEIGVHGYKHDQVFKLTPEHFRNDLKKAKDLTENIIGKKVWGFRAPAFSINKETAWALEIIAECGFLYDSSIVPTKLGRYGWKDFEKQTVHLELPGKYNLIEVPLTVIPVLGHNIPACGGGYLRYLPKAFTNWAFSKRDKDLPTIVYMHPYELDTNRYPEYFTSAIKTLNINKRIPLLLYRFMKGTVKSKLKSILSRYSFVTMKEMIDILEKGHKIRKTDIKNIHVS